MADGVDPGAPGADPSTSGAAKTASPGADPSTAGAAKTASPGGGPARPNDAETIFDEGPAAAPVGGTVLWNPGLEAPRAPGAAPSMGPRFGKYEIVETLGRGGMGVVYKAWHPGLQCHVALKVLLAGAEASSEDAMRFRREAHALAKLHHPGIVAVHDVGEEDGRTWLAMEFVAGRTLLDVLAERPGRPLDEREAVALTRQMAEALEAAHEAGVLHRDLKPGNVLVEKDGRAKLMDFGLAKLDEAAGSVATRTGELIGTPAYMSPEHVERGMAEVDPQSDVYQLGAILYEMLTGRGPYEGGSVTEVMLRVVQEEPEPPHRLRPGVDPEAETICLKAMAREKTRRYRSAKELAIDCGRFCAGEPIGARRETAGERVRRWVVRRKRFTALAAAAALALATAGVAGWEARRAGSERAEAQAALARAAEERLRLEAEVIQGLRLAARANQTGALLVRRAGGRMRDAEATFLRPLREAAEAAFARAPALAEPHAHLGRMLRALMRFDEALVEQERALAKDPALPFARYERGLLLLRRYDARLRERRGQWLRARGAELARLGGGSVQGGAPAGEPTLEELEDEEARAWKRRAREDLAAAAEAAGVIGPAPGLCGRGLLAQFAGDLAAAAKLLEEAVRLDPDLEEAWEARAHVAGRAEGAEAAAAWFARGLERDRGYVPFLEGRARLSLEAATRGWYRGQDPLPAFAACRQDFDRALELSPERAELWEVRGSLGVNEAFVRTERGQDAEASFAAAMADFARAESLAAGRAELHTSRALALINRGNQVSGRGRDPLPLYQAADDDLGRALELAPDDDETWMRRGLARVNAGNWLAGHGQDPAGRYGAGIADFEEALKRNPTREETWIKRGIARTNWGAYRIWRGEDPTDLYEAALRDFAESVRLNPTSDESWLKRGNLRINWAGHRLSRGQDAGDLLDAAVADLGEALARNPKRDETWLRRASAHTNRGYALQVRGEDAGPAYRAAEADFGQALAINAERDETWMGRGSARLNLGLHRAQRGEVPDAEYGAAIEDFAEALKRNPGRPDSWSRRGGAYKSLGDARAGRGEDPGDLYARAIADQEQAVKIHGRRSDLWKELGDARAAAARLRIRRGEDAVALWAAAAEAYGRAFEANPRDAESLLERAAAHEAAGAGEAALADYARAEKQWPRRATTFSGRALLHARAGRLDEAVADAERALAIDAEAPYYAYAARGLARLRQGRREEAAGDFAEFERRASARDPLRREVARWSEEARGGR